ncbi:DNA lyase [Candidatus Woesearchaeota archaeon CG10_big_fil_rev_8_21_14_0_10_44_13]|nr:MAG: DNA lyase [Candidatus Woesearchaeota archaeon CG10_big_fil_rev_8_21_14_0_10_44_13]
MRALRKTKKEEIRELLDFYWKNKPEIKGRLADFSKVPEKDWFYELCFCLCTPQSKARRCDISVSILKDKDFLHNDFNPSRYLIGNVRFHNNKAKYLVELKGKINMVLEKVKEAKKKKADPKELREFLVRNVKGISYKEASHFLRNIGFRGLAILDRHILKNMLRHGAVHKLPKTLSRKEYLGLEKELEAFCEEHRINIDELDLVFWSMETGEVFK